jgi:elongation factor 2 kinase
MVARTYADEYNSLGPPKRVEFILAYVLQLIDRPGRPYFTVERYIPGEYVKYNNNWDWADDRCNTPQVMPVTS